VAVTSSEHHDGCVGQDDLDGEDVGTGGAVLERVRSAAVLRDIPTQRAGRLAGGVRGVVERELGHRVGELGVDQARLDRRRPIDGVDAEQSVHARALDDHAAVDGGGTTGKARSRTARHEGPTPFSTELDDLDDALSVERKGNGQRLASRQRQRV
jgi:hypothetical protein